MSNNNVSDFEEILIKEEELINAKDRLEKIDESNKEFFARLEEEKEYYKMKMDAQLIIFLEKRGLAILSHHHRLQKYNSSKIMQLRKTFCDQCPEECFCARTHAVCDNKTCKCVQPRVFDITKDVACFACSKKCADNSCGNNCEHD